MCVARAKIEATCDGLQALLGAQGALGGDVAPIRQLVARLDGMAVEVRRAEEAVSRQVPVG